MPLRGVPSLAPRAWPVETLKLHSRLHPQDLGLELEKRNITKEAEVANIVDAGLEQIPGVSSSTTVFPNSELTPREV